MYLANFYIIYFISPKKNKNILESIYKIYGGYLYLINHDNIINIFRWVISKKEDVINITENYFLKINLILTN